ncbi:hypothetical protein KAR52_01560 [Candidatus Pacearchaeota archaeon]|nr:hypothetical protein [Candidatus Pacearchaeota archaeon]
MNFIKKVFDKNTDESVHLQFQKFSKGEFRNRAVIEAKKSKTGYTIKTSAEFANDLVRLVAKQLGSKSTKITGAIVSTSNLKDRLDYTAIKQFQGVKRYLIEKEMSGDEIISLLDEFPKTFFALTFESDISKLKIKPKAPKSGKPGKGDAAPKADFCTLKTSSAEIGASFVFEKPDFQKAQIVHTFFINKIIFPEGEDDFAEIREKAKRCGKIVRKAIIDEKEMFKEFELEA